MIGFLKKLGAVLVTLLVISLLAFLAFQIIPGDPTAKLLGTEYTPERAEALRESLGLNGSAAARYLSWLGGFVRGDFGTSYSYNQPVAELLSGKIVTTAALSLIAFLMTIIISIPTALLAARRAGGVLDRLLLGGGQVLMSIPPFFTGIIFTWIFGLVLNMFTVGKFVYIYESFWGFVGYLLLPALAIALPKGAMTAKLLRSSLVSEQSRDYVRTAISRGHSPRSALRSHVLRNALLPTITFLAMTLADIVAGSIIIEQVFSIPGLGRMLIASISNRDYPVVQAITVMIAALVVIVNFLADTLCRIIDPRVRLK
ncbi:MAG: ABC transporter permease [Oscillospiraceae bacterium]|nr:ABC transporter permease [Oscillospiraceae bacterium]